MYSEEGRQAELIQGFKWLSCRAQQCPIYFQVGLTWFYHFVQFVRDSQEKNMNFKIFVLRNFVEEEEPHLVSDHVVLNNKTRRRWFWTKSRPKILWITLTSFWTVAYEKYKMEDEISIAFSSILISPEDHTWWQIYTKKIMTTYHFLVHMI